MTEHPQAPELRHDPAPAVRAMRAPLLESLAAPPARRRPRALSAAVALGAAAVLALLWVGLGSRPEPALAVHVTDQVVELRLGEAEASSAAMTAELQEAGVRGYVVSIPVPDERAGRWVQWMETAGLEPRRRCLDPDAPERPVVTRLSAVEAAGDVLRVPAARVRESSGLFVFVAGRARRDDEEVPMRDGHVDFGLLPPEALPPEVRELLVPPTATARTRCP